MFGKYYSSKIQVCLSLKESIELVKLFGVSYFTTVNVRNSNLDIIQKNIQPSYYSCCATKDVTEVFIAQMTQIQNDSNTNVMFEFIRK